MPNRRPHQEKGKAVRVGLHRPPGWPISLCPHTKVQLGPEYLREYTYSVALFHCKDRNSFVECLCENDVTPREDTGTKMHTLNKEVRYACPEDWSATCFPALRNSSHCSVPPATKPTEAGGWARRRPIFGHALSTYTCELYHRYCMSLAPLTTPLTTALTTAEHCRFGNPDCHHKKL